jgi:four helix bundle protein
MLQSYRELLVWQKAMELAQLVYRFTEPFLKRETHGLAAQLRRAGVSVPSNIAEGYGRGSRREYLQFLSIAQGSLKELETQTILAERLNYATASQAVRVLSHADAVGKMLGSLIRSLRAKSD